MNMNALFSCQGRKSVKNVHNVCLFSQFAAQSVSNWTPENNQKKGFVLQGQTTSPVYVELK